MINFTAWPEMLAWPYLILNGWLPYRDIAIAHNPLMLLELSVFFKFFGLGITQLKIFTWSTIAINAFLTYFVTDKLKGKRIAILSSLFYVGFCIAFEGNGLWFDLAMTPLAILLFYFLKKKDYLISGLIFLIGFLTKQTFVFFGIPVVFALMKDNKKFVNNLKKLMFGSLVAGLPFMLALYILGILDDYYNWAIKFGVIYLPNVSGQISLPTLKQLLYAFAPFAIFLIDQTYLLFAIAGVMGVYPRWELFHFQPALPFLAMAISNLIFSHKNKIVKIGIGLLAGLYLIIMISRQLGTTTRFAEREALDLSNLVKEKKPVSIYVINYWDSIYPLSESLPAIKPLIPYIPWYLSYNGNDTKILDGLKENLPQIIVAADRRILNWYDLNNFISKYYSCDYVYEKVEVCQKN